MSKISDYFAAVTYIRRLFLLLIFIGALVLIGVALASGNGLLSPGTLTAVLIGYPACIAIAAIVILRKARARAQVSSGNSTEIADEATLRKFRKRIRRLQLGVAFFALVLVYALWETRDDPWPPRLIGATINLLFQVAMIQAIRRMQRQLRQEVSGQKQ